LPLVFRLEKTQKYIYLITNTKKHKTMNTEITDKKAEKQAAVSVSVTPSELRIGSLLQQEFGKIRYGSVTQINENTVRLKMEFSRLMVSYKDIEPILITEKLLKRLGFIKLGELDFFYILESEMNLKISCDLKMVAWYNLQLHNVKIKYVHQLQNLHFALTGCELQISSLTEH
jgi:hypothetical protein